MKILFLHGWSSTPGGLKPSYLASHGHEVLNPLLPDDDFEEAVRIAQAEYDNGHPDVVVGSSRGGAGRVLAGFRRLVSPLLKLFFNPAPIVHALTIQQQINEIANVYVRQNVERRSAEAQQTLNFLDEQLPTVRIEVEIARCARSRSPLSLLICDIDCFKQYNDTYGHLAGDGALQKVAKALEGSFHRGTDLVARYGGEEFVALLPDTDVADAYRMTEGMLEAVSRLEIPHKASVAVDTVSISIGVASANGHESMTKEELIERADEALYFAKENGRNQAQLSKKEKCNE